MVGYLTSVITLTSVFALFSLGLNVQWGMTGLINFGHVAFMTVGAYTTVLLSSNGVPLIVAVLAGAVLAGVLGLAIGASTLRLREDYLAIVTIGVSEVVRLVALNEEWLTRGARGVASYPLPLEDLAATWPVRIGAIALWTLIFAYGLKKLWGWTRGWNRAERTADERNKSRPLRRLMVGAATVTAGIILYGVGIAALYGFNFRAGLMLLSTTVLVLVFSQLERLGRSPWGRVLKAIREDEEVSKALGKNVFWYKLQSLMLGGAIAGIAGSFYAWQLTFINPDGFIPLMTFQAWTIVVLGGAGNNTGTLLGAAIFWAYTTLTRFGLPAVLPLDDARLGAFRIMIIGLILIVVMMLRPQGMLGRKEELTLGR
ncbi:MAG: branched-chain amino acid ABC transporter permease [Cyanophyceae cyanobacterium]